jgi:predicted secreted protein
VNGGLFIFMMMKTVTFESAGDISVREGETFKIDLPYVAGTGYQWDFENCLTLLMLPTGRCNQ